MMEVFGTVKVGDRGQIVVPMSARRKLDISPGDCLLVVSTPTKDGLGLIKVDIVREMIAKMSTGLSITEENPNRRSGRRTRKSPRKPR